MDLVIFYRNGSGAMQSLIISMSSETGYGQILAAIDGGKSPIVISGLAGIHRAHATSVIRRSTRRPVVAVCADEMEMKRLAMDLQSLTGEPAVMLSGRDFTFYNAEGVSRQLEHQRLRALHRLLSGDAPILVATVDALMQRTIPPHILSNAVMEIRNGGQYALESIIETLGRCGYSRCEQVEGPGQFALRGGILDIFSPSRDEPYRLEFFGDEVDSISSFDVATQRRNESYDAALILPAAETLVSLYEGDEGIGSQALKITLETVMKGIGTRRSSHAELKKNIAADLERLENIRSFPAADKYLELIYPMATAMDYIEETAVIFINEPAKVGERAKNYLWQLGEDCRTLLEAGILDGSFVRFARSWEELCTQAEEYPVVMADNFTTGQYPLTPKSLLNISAKQLPSYGGSIETAAGDIAHYMSAGYKTLILCSDERRATILSDYLRERQITACVDFSLLEMPEYGTCTITLGTLSAGMEYPSAKLAVITEGQFVEPAALRKKRKRLPSNRERLQSFTDLSPGDLVVHEHHGIGRYVGIFKMPVDGIEKDYIKIAYAGTDSLYVPTTQLDLVSKYIGGGEKAPTKLSRMGGAEWTRTKIRAKSAAKEMAKELIELYAARQRQKGHAFAPDSVWQTEFEERFGYQETDDQIRSIEEIKVDMENIIPMDRLLCGDVGYGKTEVALRAVMKAVLDGYQAAILVPTTVLAQQHYATIMRRFAGYPIKIEVLSRFRTAAQMKAALKNITTGSVDIIIGTHRLIQKDIQFKKLGLLIIDEEQRFGVTHKERLKDIARQVDVLTLSATPIPRTMNMALSGIRDMSTIEEPPRDRQPVQTYVLEHDWNMIQDAIKREVSRGGQVYYIHNRVENIERTASRLSAMLEGISVAVAHGKMDEVTLRDVMERMTSGDIQVLVCTTIIETGIDIPNVNTLIIEDADKLGLSQLHQIRGRVGRSSRRAFAYLTFRQGKILTEVAEKRLSAIREFAEFNSGFKIAMRDLEIRGAGNLLGAEQSGHMMSVGYDMYLKLLEEAVLEEKGERPEKRADCAADLTVSANIPEKYVPSGEQRMDLYRRIARIRVEEDADEMIAELIDRFGDPPHETVTLVNIALLRGEATLAGIDDIAQKGGFLRLKLNDFDMNRISAVYSRPEYKGRVKIEAGNVPVVSLKLRGAKIVDEALKFVRAYSNAL